MFDLTHVTTFESHTTIQTFELNKSLSIYHSFSFRKPRIRATKMVKSVVNLTRKELSASQKQLIDKIALLAPCDFGTQDSTYVEPLEPEPLLKAIQSRLSVNPASLDNCAVADVHTVSTLFDELFTRHNLSPQIVWLLTHLRLPILRVVMETEASSQSQSAALALLNEMVRAGVAWTPAANRQRDSFYNKICAIVETLSRQGNESEFAKCLADFELFIKAENRRAQLIEERIVSAEQADSKKAAAVKVANEHISSKFLGLKLPSIVNTFLATAWSHVLFFIYHKEPSKESADWEWATVLEDELLSFSGLHNNDRRNFLQQLVEQLTAAGIDTQQAETWVKKLEPALPKIEYPPVRETNIKPEKPASLTQPSKPPGPASGSMTPSSEMQPANSSVETHKSPNPKAETPQPDTAGLQSPPVVSDSRLNDASVDHTALAKKIDHLRMGSWVRFTEQGVETKLRVAAILKHTQTWVFVNRNGSKAGSFNRQQLLEMLITNHMVIIEDATHFDSALEYVISNLRGH
jgi:hypothetical protein